MVARVGDPKVGCDLCGLPFIDPLPPNLVFDLEYERWRWLPNEPIVYIGKTHQAIGKRVGEFYRHRCGDRSPHAGGEVVKLLQCDLWVYWSSANSPYATERTMIRAFRQEAGQIPFANDDEKRIGKRIRPSSANRSKSLRPTKKAKTVTFEVSIWWNPEDQAIHFASKEAGKFILTVKRDPTSKRGHPKLFRELAKVLKAGGAPAP